MKYCCMALKNICEDDHEHIGIYGNELLIKWYEKTTWKLKTSGTIHCSYCPFCGARI